VATPPGKCVFCGGTGLTKSHIWPDWMDQYLPPRAEYYVQAIGEVNTFSPRMRRPQVERHTRQGDARARKPRNTCRRCNGGWMSQIESNAIGPSVPLIQGKPFAAEVGQHSYMLNAWGQRAIASLLCLITMRVEFMHPPTQAASVTDRTWIKDKMEPPPFWQVWIARYSGTKAAEHWCRHYGLDLVSSPSEIRSAPKCNTQATTYVLGQLCAHVFSSTVLHDFTGYGGALCKIWPLTGWDVDCRHLPVIGDKGVISLSEALAREIPPVPER
jgi:hypothetical protein